MLAYIKPDADILLKTHVKFLNQFKYIYFYITNFI